MPAETGKEQMESVSEDQPPSLVDTLGIDLDFYKHHCLQTVILQVGKCPVAKEMDTNCRANILYSKNYRRTKI